MCWSIAAIIGNRTHDTVKGVLKTVNTGSGVTGIGAAMNHFQAPDPVQVEQPGIDAELLHLFVIGYQYRRVVVIDAGKQQWIAARALKSGNADVEVVVGIGKAQRV